MNAPPPCRPADDLDNIRAVPDAKSRAIAADTFLTLLDNWQDAGREVRNEAVVEMLDHGATFSEAADAAGLSISMVRGVYDTARRVRKAVQDR